MRFVKEVPDLKLLAAEYSLTEKQREDRKKQINEIQAIVDGADRRKILIVGPCFADREDAVLEYMNKLVELKEKVKEAFLIIPRIYTSKPRTNGLGYKGLLHRPNPTSANDDLLKGLVATRRMHYRVIAETGMYGADEMLYPDVFYYYMHLVCYAAVGARSVENQQHSLSQADWTFLLA
jgi:3-deoxy-7-phosphoheptulonate synthase